MSLVTCLLKAATLGEREREKEFSDEEMPAAGPSGTGLVSAAPRLNTEIHKSEYVARVFEKKKKTPSCLCRREEEGEIVSGPVSNPSSPW